MRGLPRLRLDKATSCFSRDRAYFTNRWFYRVACPRETHCHTPPRPVIWAPDARQSPRHYSFASLPSSKILLRGLVQPPLKTLRQVLADLSTCTAALILNPLALALVNHTTVEFALLLPRASFDDAMDTTRNHVVFYFHLVNSHAASI